YFLQRDPLLFGELGRNTVDFFRIIRNVKPVRFNQIILMLDDISHRIMQLPSNLNTARPTVRVRNRCIPTLRQTRCLGIKDYIHRLNQSIKKYSNGRQNRPSKINQYDLDVIALWRIEIDALRTHPIP